jgi:hypothetical protein
MYEREPRLDDIYLVAHGITPERTELPAGEFDENGLPRPGLTAPDELASVPSAPFPAE